MSTSKAGKYLVFLSTSERVISLEYEDIIQNLNSRYRVRLSKEEKINVLFKLRSDGGVFLMLPLMTFRRPVLSSVHCVGLQQYLHVNWLVEAKVNEMSHCKCIHVTNILALVLWTRLCLRDLAQGKARVDEGDSCMD